MMETNQIRPFGSRTRSSDPSDHLDKRGLDFWTEYLAGAPALLELPTDRPRPAVPGFAGSAAVALSAELAAGLRGLSQRHGGTLFMTLLAGWSVLLARLSGQTDMVIG